MASMFNLCQNLEELNLTSFNTGNVINMMCMFCGCSNMKKLDLSSFDIHNVTNMLLMFAACEKLEKPKVNKSFSERIKQCQLIYIGKKFDSI